MEWIKRNLGFVVVGAASLVLLGVAAWFLFAEMAANSMADQTLNDLLARREQLWSAPVHPDGKGGTNNIDLVHKDRERLGRFLGEIKGVIPQMPAPSALDDQGLKSLLERTIFQLDRTATNGGVAVPDAFGFSFEAVRGRFRFGSNSIPPLVLQLGDVEALASILIESHVISIQGIRRSSITEEDQTATGAVGLLGLSAKTNEFVVSLPYELTFQGFSGDLADVVNRMMRSDRCMVVKNIDVVQTAPSEAGEMRSGYPERMNRFGRRNPYEAYQRPEMAANPTQPTVVLDSQPLRITMLVDIVRLVGSSAH